MSLSAIDVGRHCGRSCLNVKYLHSDLTRLLHLTTILYLPILHQKRTYFQIRFLDSEDITKSVIRNNLN